MFLSYGIAGPSPVCCALHHLFGNETVVYIIVIS